MEDPIVEKRQIFEGDYDDDDYWWHSSASFFYLWRFDRIGTEMLICVGWPCRQVVHRGCHPLDSCAVAHRRLLSRTKKNEARHASPPVS